MIAPREIALGPNLLDRIPPADATAEQAVIGSCLVDPKAFEKASEIVGSKDFYEHRNQLLFDNLCAMAEAGVAIDTTTLVVRLRRTGSIEAIGGMSYLAEVVNAASMASNVAHYATTVAKLAKYRAMIVAGMELIREGYAASDEPADVLNRAEAALSEIATGDFSGEPMHISRIVPQVLQRIDEIRQRQQSVGTLTGLYKFDRDLGGLFPGELTILAARPRIGKTSLACQIAHHVACRDKLVYFASLEMGAMELVQRLVCTLSSVNGTRIRTARIDDSEVERLRKGAEKLAKVPLLIHERPSMSANDIRRSARRLIKHGLGMIVVDYLQIVTPADRKAQRYVQVGDTAKALRVLAKECKVPVLCLAQVGRAVEQTSKKGGKDSGVKRPTIADLRESGDIENHSDVVLFIHRQEAGWAASGEQSEAELLVDKNRNGITGAYKLTWVPTETRFVCEEQPHEWTEFVQFDGEQEAF